MRYKLWDLGCTHSINPYFDLYAYLNPLLGEGYSKKKLTLANDFNAGLLAIKDQSDVQYFLSQSNIDDLGN